ncbi:17888_t:CDS:2, partial [Racocetra fulgida]
LAQNVKVPRESTYDAEIYRILHNWLAKVHGFEITGQWHLEEIGDDAVIEVLATESIPKLEKHFEQVLEYADLLCSKEEAKHYYFWHDREFKNVHMSAKLQDATGKVQTIIDEAILP